MHSFLTLPLDPHVFSLALKSCAAINRPRLGAAIHGHSAKACLLINPFIACSLIDMYGKCMSISLARHLFDEIPRRSVVVWNSIISLYTHSNNMPMALELFANMDVAPSESSFNSIIAGLSELDDDGSLKALAFYRQMWHFKLRPNLITVLALLRACLSLAALSLIKEIHGYSVRNAIYPHTHLSSGLVEAYGRCGYLINAHNVFLSISEKDVVAWSSLISAYAFHGEAKTALEIFKQMEIEGVKPDEITFLGVLKACSHAGLADEAKDYVERMYKDFNVEVSSDHYACLVDVLSRAGRLEEAYEVIQKMPVKVTAKAWGALLGACRTFGEVELAEIASRALFELEPDNAANYVLLGRIYASEGRYEESQSVRVEMEERGVKATPGLSWVIYQD